MYYLSNILSTFTNYWFSTATTTMVAVYTEQEFIKSKHVVQTNITVTNNLCCIFTLYFGVIIIYADCRSFLYGPHEVQTLLHSCMPPIDPFHAVTFCLQSQIRGILGEIVFVL